MAVSILRIVDIQVKMIFFQFIEDKGEKKNYFKNKNLNTKIICATVPVVFMRIHLFHVSLLGLCD